MSQSPIMKSHADAPASGPHCVMGDQGIATAVARLAHEFHDRLPGVRAALVTNATTAPQG